MSMKRDKMVSTSQSPRFHLTMTLREEIMGRKLVKGRAGPSDLKSNAKMQHFQNLSLWACREVALPPLGALFGHHFATCQEAAGVPRDPSLFHCQRCESILQPGYNCTVRVEKHGCKMRRQRKRPNIPTKNNVIYTCHFCSHRNQIRGTPRGHVEELIASKQKPVSELKPTCETENTSKKVRETISSKDVAFPMSMNFMAPQDHANVIHDENCPQHSVKTLLSEGKKRKRRQSEVRNSEKTEDKTTMLDAGSCGSSRKRKKSWSSLREITENSEKEKRQFIANLKVPFFLG